MDEKMYCSLSLYLAVYIEILISSYIFIKYTFCVFLRWFVFGTSYECVSLSLNTHTHTLTLLGHLSEMGQLILLTTDGKGKMYPLSYSWFMVTTHNDAKMLCHTKLDNEASD